MGQINTAFMNSPEHRANILGNYNQLGTGAWAATGSWSGGGSSVNGAIMYTEIFINAPRAGAPPPPPPPPPPPSRPAPRPVVNNPTPVTPVVVPDVPALTEAPVAEPQHSLMPGAGRPR